MSMILECLVNVEKDTQTELVLVLHQRPLLHRPGQLMRRLGIVRLCPSMPALAIEFQRSNLTSITTSSPTRRKHKRM